MALTSQEAKERAAKFHARTSIEVLEDKIRDESGAGRSSVYGGNYTSEEASRIKEHFKTQGFEVSKHETGDYGHVYAYTVKVSW